MTTHFDSAVYSRQCNLVCSQATEELAVGDSRQASEKAWGAAAQIVKALGEDMGIPHDSHRGLYNVVNTFLGEHDRDETIRHGFAAATELRKNFYEGYLDSDVEGVEERFKDVGRMIDRINELSGRPRGT